VVVYPPETGLPAGTGKSGTENFCLLI